MRKQTKLVAVLSAAALLAIGASMTSFAAAPHWDREGDEWVYLDRNGDKVTDEWKKSNGQWYYLDSDGYMAKDMVIEDEDDKYYVDENGARVSNAWVSMDNDDLLDDEDEDIDTVWMYFDNNGKALGCNTTNGQMKQLSYGDGQTGYFIFNNDGYMLSGWKKWCKSGNTDDDELYYLGDQNEGWAATGWKYLPVDNDIDVFSSVDEDDNMYTDESWFYFKTNGKAVTNEDSETISGKKYAFDEFGRMVDLWVQATSSSLATSSVTTYTNRGDASSSGAIAFYREADGDREKSDWVQAYVNSDYDSNEDDLRWFYVNSKGEPFKAGYIGGEVFDEEGSADRIDDSSKMEDKYSDEDTYSGVVRTKSIKNETYLFNNKGVMLTGLYKLGGKQGDKLGGVCKGTAKEATYSGIYFFNTSSGSVTGQMVTNKRVTIDCDGEDKTYYFNKSGRAYTGAIINGYVYYGLEDEKLKDGQLVEDYGDGSDYELVKIEKIVDPVTKDGKSVYELKDKNGGVVQTFTEGNMVAINGNGKIRKSGTFDDVNDQRVKVTDYVATYDKDTNK